jgi:hypothetical protein
MIPSYSFQIPDPDFFPSRIPDLGVKKAPDPGFATLNKGQGLNRYYNSVADPGCLSRPDPDFYPSRIPGNRCIIPNFIIPNGLFS